jgi:hypothetical protein
MEIGDVARATTGAAQSTLRGARRHRHPFTHRRRCSVIRGLGSCPGAVAPGTGSSAGRVPATRSNTAPNTTGVQCLTTPTSTSGVTRGRGGRGPLGEGRDAADVPTPPVTLYLLVHGGVQSAWHGGRDGRELVLL